MSKTAYAEGWAVCGDYSGMFIDTVSRTRQESIGKFMDIVEGPRWTQAQWRYWKRRGFRASHVSINEYLFGKGDTK